MKKALFLSVLSLLLFQSCSDDDSVTHPLEISIEDARLKLSNQSFQTIYYFAVDEGSLILSSWAPMVGDDQPQIGARKVLKVPFEEVTHFTEETERISVFYWTAVTKDGRKTAGPVTQVSISLFRQF
ncbi:hypothetical protein [Ekhidna sp.]|uniref:hypothetical protein n=1 Tax=Ekhidna sp. TaxID=2608089 RepID=UPI003B5094C2